MNNCAAHAHTGKGGEGLSALLNENVVTIFRALQRVRQRMPVAQVRIALDVGVGEAHFLTPTSETRLESNREPNDRSDDFDHRQRLGRNHIVEELIRDVGAIAFTLKGATELLRILNVFGT